MICAHLNDVFDHHMEVSESAERDALDKMGRKWAKNTPSFDEMVV